VELSRDDNDEVRLKVANNSKTPVDTLDILSLDQDEWVRYWVAQNTNTPVETLDILSRDQDESVRLKVAWNPKWKRLKEMGTLDLAIAISKYLGIF